jgi:hypothetical protein
MSQKLDSKLGEGCEQWFTPVIINEAEYLSIKRLSTYHSVLIQLLQVAKMNKKEG